jgi:tripartite-type tricarboxylate transporter receptor subunit TctC
MMAEPAPNTPAEFAAFVKAELAKYEHIVKATGARVG